LARLDSPRCLSDPCGELEDKADWLFVREEPNHQGIIFKATDVGAGGITPRDSAVTTGIYPVGGAANYWTLNKNDWDDSVPATFGQTLANIGHFDGMPGKDIVIVPNDGVTTQFHMYSYSLADDSAGNAGFVRRAIVRSTNSGYAYSVAGIGNFAAATDETDTQFVVTTWPSGKVHLYR